MFSWWAFAVALDAPQLFSRSPWGGRLGMVQRMFYLPPLD